MTGGNPMTRLKAAAIGLSVMLLILSCSSQKPVQKGPPPKFQGMVLAKAVDESGTIGVPQDQTSEFNTEDEHAIALVTLENMSGTHKLRWEWVDPKGKVYLSTKNYPLKVNKGKFLPKVTAWHQISLRDEAAVDSPGEWSVKLFVDDELIDSQPFVVKVLADPLVLPPGVAAKPYPKDWALIIGIEDYNRLPKVEYARKDALIVREYFIRVLGVPEANIISLIDTDATKARIEGYLKQYIPNNVGADATLYVYFAGHGMPGTKKGEPYLVPFDADTRFIEQTGYKLVSFYQDLYQLDLKRVYVFLDSCFSGVASRAAEMLVKGARPALVHVEKVSPPSSSIISLNATSTGQISNAYPEKRHGLFTYYLLRGMKGEADEDHDGWTSMKEMYGYVRKHVTRESRRMQSEQVPSIVPPSDQWKDIALSQSVE
jgi:hypothetical protein